MKTPPVQVPRAVTPAKTSDATPWLPLQRVRTLEMDSPSQAGRSAHVSAASGLVKIGERLFIAADDELSLAAFHGSKKGEWVPVVPGTLPLETEARKAAKPDFEALAAVPAMPGAPHGGVFTLTSGSRENRTQGAFVPLSADGAPGKAQAVDLGPLLRSLGRLIDDLNIEGAVVVGGSLRLLHRGGEAGGNAFIDVDLTGLMRAVSDGQAPDPALVTRITPLELGKLGGVSLGLSDASMLPDGSMVFTASAEATDDPLLDGAVTGSIIGIIGPDGRLGPTFPVKGLKLEGVHAEIQGNDVHVLLVSDADDPKIAAPLMSAVLPGVAPKVSSGASAKSTFDATAAAQQAAASPAEFTAAVKASRDTVSTTEVNQTAKQVRRELNELRHFARLMDQGGLQPDRIRVEPFAPGAPESEWLKADDGKLSWLVRTKTGEVPEGLQALAVDRGVKDIAKGAVEGARAVSMPADVSPKASFGRAMKLADQLFGAAGGDPKSPDHQLFRYTIARYMLNATTPQALAYLADNFTGTTRDLLATGQVPARWVEKLERGFRSTYTNDEALAWLSQMAAKLTDAKKFVDENNPNNSPITFYTAGSTTKARWSVGSDLDILIDTPDTALMDKVLKGPFGFYGTADKEEFAILNASFYWDRTTFFGTPVELSKGTADLKPEVVEKVFKQTSKDNWGVEWRSTPEGSRVDITPAAAEKFVREAPPVTEVLYDASRPTRAQVDTKWVTEHWVGVTRSAPELRLLSRATYIAKGEALVKALLPEALAKYGREGMSAMGMDDFLGLTDPAERLFVDFAGAERAKAAVAAGGTVADAWNDALKAASAAT